MQTNLVDMIRSKSPKTQQQVASKMLDVIVEEEGKPIQGCSVVLSTKGTPKTVTIGKSKVARPCPKYSIEDLTKLQTTRNLSDKDTLAVASFIRVKAGRSSVEPYLKKGLTDRNNKLDGMFMEKEMSMKVKPKKNKSDKEDIIDSGEEDGLDSDGFKVVKRPGIFVKDVNEYTKFLIEERALHPQKNSVLFGFDDGQGILKIMEIVKTLETPETEQKMSSYRDGVCAKTSKLSSVKKLFVIGLVPDVQENYQNVRDMMEELS